MLKISNIKIPAKEGKDGLLPAVAAALGTPEKDILTLEIKKLSVDSRRKNDVHFVYTAAVSLKDEDRALAYCKKAEVFEEKVYSFPYSNPRFENRPVVIGMGPAGLFAALCLAEAGIPPIILERGRPVEERASDVERFWRDGKLDITSNVQFGEGGAGTFSDGKLTTGINDERISFVIRSLVKYGAPEDILYLAKPHIGTGNLREIVKNIRLHLIALGCDVRFGHVMAGITAADGRLSAIKVLSGSDKYELKTGRLVLAPGNSARDTFRMLHEHGVVLQPKSFAVGVRIEHLQADVDLAQYGEAATLGTLPASDYKLSVHLPDGRSVYTFCVCPGGSVVAAASEEGTVVTNGMSEYARDGKNINGGLLVGVSPVDFGEDIFGGVDFQSRLEKAAFAGGGGGYRAPAQLVKDFLSGKPSKKPGRVKPTYMPGVNWCSLWDVLPGFVCKAIAEALPLMDKKIRGFASPDAVLTAVETRSSSPLRIVRDGDFCASVKGIYPAGEGAGYAGGITSAAVDGIKCAEALCKSLSSSL
ncbi:MAG: NAD(P)/FAD-dependent oxidoreductase [Oscillospiraceae bacterium]